MDKIINKKKITSKRLETLSLQLNTITKESSQRLAILCTRPFDGIENDMMIDFIKKYMKSKYPTFIVELYKFLHENDSELSEKYLKLFNGMRETEEKRKVTTKGKDKRKKVDKTDKLIRRGALDRANRFVKSQRDERKETKEKIKRFYGDVQKFK